MISIVVISKDEPSLDDTLTDVREQAEGLGEPFEIVVVDASQGRLDGIRERHAATVRWVPFEPIPGVRFSIPHQRNAGVREALGEIIVFTDAGCTPAADWLCRLVFPLHDGEHITSGVTLSSGDDNGLYDPESPDSESPTYLRECSTINLAFSRAAFDAIGGFDEGFAYGSDVDFSWRLNDAGYRILSVADAVIRHDWGNWRRQLRRSYRYGKARLRLYRKHRGRLKHVLRTDPVVVVYPAFLLGLPLTVVFPLYPALLLIPAWRNRSRGAVRVLANHLMFGLGVLIELIG
jgi:glycosyltransferase involved in cell wall biosynthesis